LDKVGYCDGARHELRCGFALGPPPPHGAVGGLGKGRRHPLAGGREDEPEWFIAHR
jgi:hypothetical protein